MPPELLDEELELLDEELEDELDEELDEELAAPAPDEEELEEDDDEEEDEDWPAPDELELDELDELPLVPPFDPPPPPPQAPSSSARLQAARWTGRRAGRGRMVFMRWPGVGNRSRIVLGITCVMADLPLVSDEVRP